MNQPEQLDLTEAFTVEKKSRDWFRLIPRRRSGDYSLPLTLDRKLSIDNEFRIGDELLNENGLESFAGGSNAESDRRPIPEVFRTSDTDKVTNAVVPELPKLYEWLLPQVRAPWQSYNEVARMGAPIYKPYDDKAWILRRILPSYLAGDFAFLEGHAVQIGVRIQSEPITKVRQYTFIRQTGEVYKDNIDRRNCKVKVWGHDRYPGRVRQVFNQPVPNLLNQIVDTAFNDVYGRHPAFHHDMTRAGPLVKGPVMAFDVSHMERLTARIVHERSIVIGGRYAEFQAYMRQMPFLVPSDDGECAFFVKCNFDKGWSVQFGSGNSAVAPSQKDIFIILYKLFAVQALNIPESMAFDWVAKGGDERLRIFNFGDDNFDFSPVGDSAILDDLFTFMSQYLTVSREEPPKFLGHEFDGSDFKLTVASYILKTYQNERGPVPPFRRFPNLGWVEKRRHYGQFGYPILPKKIFSDEDAKLKAAGASFADVLWNAAQERANLDAENAARRAYFLSPAYLMGKQDYMIDHETKVKVGSLGGYTGFTPDETSPILIAAIDKKWAQHIKNAS